MTARHVKRRDRRAARDQLRRTPRDEQRQHRITATGERNAQRCEGAGLLVIALHANGERFEQIVERAIARVDVLAADRG